MKTVITVQHTQSEHHVNGMVGSWTDWPLTQLGLNQADAIGRRLAKELEGKSPVIYSSDLKRAAQTAQAVGKYLGVDPIFDQALRERNLGKCVGKSVQWLKENLECQEKTVDDRLFSDAESRRDAWLRLRPFFDKLTAGPDEYVVVVSHGDLLSLFNAMWLGLEVESLDSFELYGLSGGVSWLFENNDGKRFIRRLSDMSYIDIQEDR